MDDDNSDTDDFLEFDLCDDNDEENYEDKITRICDRVNQNRGQGWYKKRSSLSSISVTFEENVDTINSTQKSDIFSILDKLVTEAEEIEKPLTQELIFSQITAALQSLEERPKEHDNIEQKSSLELKKRTISRTWSQDSYLLKRFRSSDTTLTTTKAPSSSTRLKCANTNDITVTDLNDSLLSLNTQEQELNSQQFSQNSRDIATQTDTNETINEINKDVKEIVTKDIATDAKELAIAKEVPTDVNETTTTTLTNDSPVTEIESFPYSDDLFSTSNIGRNALIKYIEDAFHIEKCKSNGAQKEDQMILSQYFDTSEDLSNSGSIKLLLSTINDDIISILKESIENAKILETIKQQDYNILTKEEKNQLILNKIYGVFNDLISKWNQNKELEMTLCKFRHYKDCIFDKERCILLPNYDKPQRVIKNIPSKQTFRLVTFLLRKIITLIKSDGYCTRREIYYQINNLIKRQNCIDDAVVDICCTLNLAPWDIKIVASSKGLIYGNLKIVMTNAEIINCNIQGGILVPQSVNEIDKFETRATFVLVVEKDSMFQKLLDENIMDKLNQPFIMVTGKGNPDINTRHLLHQIFKKTSLPMYILVDADPYGINIYFTYKFGSIKYCHLSEQLAVPNIKWLGILPNEIAKLDLTVQELTKRDQIAVQHLLASPYAAHFPLIRKELQILAEKNVKAEMEGLMKTNTFFSDYYLPHKFMNSDFL